MADWSGSLTEAVHQGRARNRPERGNDGASWSWQASGRSSLTCRGGDGTFEPVSVEKRERRLTGVDEMILSLDVHGLTPGWRRRRPPE